MMDRLSFALALVILSIAGCQPTPQIPSSKTPEPLEVTRLSLHADDKGKQGPEVKVFDYQQKTLHFRALLNRPVEGAKGKWIFSAKSTSAGGGRDIQAIEGAMNGNEIRAQITLATPWPVGTYHVDVLINDTPVHSFDYEVSGEKSAIVFLSHGLAPDDGKGLPGKLVTSFHPGDRTIHLQVTTKGVDTTEPVVVWRLFRVSKGKDNEIGNTQQPKIKLQDSVLKATFSSPGDWAKGEYRADIFMDNKKVHSISFKVE